MAQIFGQGGRFAEEATYGHTKRIIATAFFAIGIVAFLCGYKYLCDKTCATRLSPAEVQVLKAATLQFAGIKPPS